MLYGCEVWGYENNQQLLVTCNYFLKRILKLSKSTPTCMLYGETGFTNPSQLIDNRLINFWYSIANGSDSKISSILYKFIKSVYDLDVYKSPWLDKIITLLNVGMLVTCNKWNVKFV